jgi:hypothetical protein
VTLQLEQKKEAEKQAQLAAMRQHHEDMMRKYRQDQENRATLKLLKFGQEFTKSWIFSYFVLWPRGSYERWAGLIYIIYAWQFCIFMNTVRGHSYKSIGKTMVVILLCFDSCFIDFRLLGTEKGYSNIQKRTQVHLKAKHGLFQV